MIRLKELGNGLVSLVFDRPNGEHNYQDNSSLNKLKYFIDEIVINPGIKGVIITSAKKTFLVGGDLGELKSIKLPHDAQVILERNHTILRTIELSNIPFVAAINGLALGGGLELALACNYRIGVDEPHFKLGLPEVSLGLMPGAGGTQRLPRLVGLEEALPIILEGKKISARKALKIGLIDQCVEKENLLEAASEYILSGKVSSKQPWDQKQKLNIMFAKNSTKMNNLIKPYSTKQKKLKPGLEPAPNAIVETIVSGLTTTFDKALNIEVKAFSNLVIQKSVKNKIRTLFYGVNEANKFLDRPKNIKTYNISNIAVLGAGLMGSGIAYCAAYRGCDVILLDNSASQLDRAKTTIERKAVAAHKIGIIKKNQIHQIMDRVITTTKYETISKVDMVIEAVSENKSVKKSVLKNAVSFISKEVPIATNTSTIPITEIAKGSVRPDNLIGLHFFAPVDRMRLVEVVRGSHTSRRTLARSLDFLAKLRKTPIVVNDGLGFFTSRVVAAYTGEALTLLAEGICPKTIDTIATNAGMPIGPLSMADVTSLTLLRDLFNSLIGDGKRIGLRGMLAIKTLDKLIIEFNRTGKESGRGIYEYNNGVKKGWGGISKCFTPTKQEIIGEIIEKRLLYSQVLESVRTLEEKIITNPMTADLGSVLGWGFPSGYGGTIGLIESIGIQPFIEECEILVRHFGARFTVPTLLKEMSNKKQHFYMF